MGEKWGGNVSGARPGAAAPPLPLTLTSRLRASGIADASLTLPCPRSNLNSAKKMIKQGGEWVVAPHVVPPTGFKAPNAYGATPVFDGMTTNKYFQSKVLTGNVKKLMPYYPNAPRNRPPETARPCRGFPFFQACVVETADC